MTTIVCGNALCPYRGERFCNTETAILLDTGNAGILQCRTGMEAMYNGGVPKREEKQEDGRDDSVNEGS